MSDSELSDGMDELQELIAEYEEKEKAKDSEAENEVKIKTEEHQSKQANKSSRPAVPMDKVLFGDKESFLENLAKAVGQEEVPKVEEDADDASADEDESAPGQQKRKAKKRKPVWTDADDEVIRVGEVKRETKYTGPLDHLRKDKPYKEFLTTRFQRIVTQPKWASLDRKPTPGDVDEEDELLHTVGFLAKGSGASTLAPHDIRVKRLKDLNRATYAEGEINSIQFHPTSTAALVAGEHGIATIYGIDGRKNEKLHSIRFDDFPIRCAKITPSGTRAIFGSKRNRRHYYSYDLLTAQETRYHLPRDISSMSNFQLSPCGRYMAVAGRFGLLHLFDAVSHELIVNFKQENVAADCRFTGDSLRLICSSAGSVVNIFSLRQQRLEHSFTDDGCIRGRVIDLAPNQRLLATGSNEGVVNVYDFADVQQSRTPLPVKTFYNLTTSISDVRFNHTSELLAMCSIDAPAAVKVAHFPSGTVYANFPGFKSNVGKIRTVEFSPGSGYLALGNRGREVPLFRVKHFENY